MVSMAPEQLMELQQVIEATGFAAHELSQAGADGGMAGGLAAFSGTVPAGVQEAAQEVPHQAEEVQEVPKHTGSAVIIVSKGLLLFVAQHRMLASFKVSCCRGVHCHGEHVTPGEHGAAAYEQHG
jgi:hypothetical protein